jgi:hypothetical protein
VWAVILFFGWVDLGALSEDRGRDCDSPAECDMYEPPEDVGIP